jgi:hypothetical protein
LRVPQQCEATTLGEDKNKNGKRIPETVKETQITGKKARKLNKKNAKLENLQEVKETRMEDFADWNLAGGRFTGFEPRWNNRSTQIWTSPWRSYITIGGTPTIRVMHSRMVRKHIYGFMDYFWTLRPCHNG